MARPLTITAYGDAQVDTTNKKSGTGSLQLDGTGDYLIVDNTNGEINTTGNWTIECWFYANDAANADYFIFDIASRTGSKARFELQVQIDSDPNNKIAFLTNQSLVGSMFFEHVINKASVIDAWHHLAITRNGGTVKMWFDGQLQTTSTGNTYADLQLFDSFNDPEDLQIGSNTNASNLKTSFFDGWLDEIRISNVERYTANFTPDSRFAPDDNTLLLIHADGADTSTTFTDDIGILGSATLSAFNNFEATANPNPSMVYLGNDQYTWDDTNTWDEILNYHDRWLQPEVITAEFGIEAVGTQVRLGDSNINSEFTLACEALNLKRADASLAMSVSLDVSAENFKDAASTLDSNTTITATSEVEVDGRAQLDSALSLDCSARILKLASLFIEPLATMTVEGEVSIDGRAQLDTEFDASTKAGLLVQVNEPYDYTWDDPASWDQFVLDRWGPQGFLAFSNIQLTALGSRLVDASSVLDTVFDADFQVGLLQDGASDLDLAFTVTAEGERIQPGETEMSSAFALDVTVDLFRAGTAELNAEFQSQAFAGIILDARAELADLLEFGIAAGVIKQDTVELSMVFGIDATGNTTLDGRSSLDAEFTQTTDANRLVGGQATLECFNFLVSDGISNPAIQAAATLAAEFTVEPFGGVIKRAEADLDTEFTVTASAGRVLDAESVLSAFGFVISEGRISDIRGQATLDSEFTLTSSSSVAIDGRATLSALGFVVSDGRLSDVRGQATLNMVFGGSFEGDLRLLESGSVLRIVSETRTLTVGSEVRGLPVLPETRVLEIER